MLAVARACGDKASLWDKARSAGIPWQRKTWTALSNLQKLYNDGVETELPALLLSEKTVDREGGKAYTVQGDLGPYAPGPGLGTVDKRAGALFELGEHDDTLSSSSLHRRSAPAPKKQCRWPYSEERDAALSGSPKKLRSCAAKEHHVNAETFRENEMEILRFPTVSLTGNNSVHKSR